MDLPVKEIEPQIRAIVSQEQSRLLLKAPTGSGKSTLVPAMVRAGAEGQVIVVQPRRLAARLLAEFVAKNLGTVIGKGVGYAIRFQNKSGPETEILFVTDGVLRRRLVEDPELKGVGAVVFDEFHERRLASDLTLAQVLELQEGTRPDLRLVVMSATLDYGPLREYLEPCEVLETKGRTFPVEIEHRGEGQVTKRGGVQNRELWDRVAAVIKGSVGNFESGDRILVFLPGVFEIRRTQSLLQNLGALSGWEVLPLYSGLKPEAQQAAIRSDSSKRIILATNVAETSITIEGVKLVVDSGLARQSHYDLGRGFDSLRIEKISKAAADQRAGRAGRTGPGRCIRLWSQADHQTRHDFEVPEVRRVDLADGLLFLKVCGVRKISQFRWIEPPEDLRQKDALNLLHWLGAIDGDEQLTKKGRKMASFPMHPRLAALVMSGTDCPGEVLFVAAACQGEGIFKPGGKGPKWSDFASGEPGWINDFAGEWLAMIDARDCRFDPGRCEAAGILARGARETWQTFQQFCRQLSSMGVRIKEPDFRQRGEACARAMLGAFGDRLASRRDQGSIVCHVAGGRKGKLHPKSMVRNAPVFLAVSMIEVEGKERNVMLSRCAEISEDWLPDDEIEKVEAVVFDEDVRRVVAVKQRSFRGLVLEEKRGGEVDPALAGEVLAGRVLAGDLILKKWDGKVRRWIARLKFLRNAMPELELPGFEDDDRALAVGQICAGATTFREVRDRDPWPVLREWLSAPQRSAMDAFAPEKIELENGRSSRIHYEAESDPWIQEKAQRLYGVRQTPTIANGHPLVVKILAPNQRPWQVTSDLEGFWESGFAQMKKDLAGRYPKHDWTGGTTGS